MPENCDREMPKSPQIDLPLLTAEEGGNPPECTSRLAKLDPDDASWAEMLHAYERYAVPGEPRFPAPWGNQGHAPFLTF